MNRDLFLSILALDSYNRGYGQRMNGLADTGAIGTATITKQSATTTKPAAFKADFYAIAYNYNGQTVISYRGTDNFAKDLENGYGVGLGFSGGILARQADLALQFYTSKIRRQLR